MPGLAAITTCPRTGTTAGSGTRSWAAAPEQLTIDRGRAGQPGQRGDRRTPRGVPPARSNLVRRYSRYTGMVASGAV